MGPLGALSDSIMVDYTARVYTHTPALHGTWAACQHCFHTGQPRSHTCSPSSRRSHQRRGHGRGHAHTLREQHGISHTRRHTAHPAKPPLPGHTLQQQHRLHRSSITVAGRQSPHQLHEPCRPACTQHWATRWHTPHEHEPPYHTHTLADALHLPRTLAHCAAKGHPAPQRTPHTCTLSLGSGPTNRYPCV